MTNVEMNVTVGQGDRRLPIFLLLDCSGSMFGAPIEAVKQGLREFETQAKADPFASQTAAVGIITFNSDARLVTNGLVPMDQFQAPALTASGSTALGKALQLLQQAIDTHVKPAVKGGAKGDWKPLTYILTDGYPTDEWRGPRQEILKRVDRKVLNVITVGCGPSINEQNLHDIAIGPTFRMDNSTESFKTFFDWLTQTVGSVSRTLSQTGGHEQAFQEPKPPSSVIQFLF